MICLYLIQTPMHRLICPKCRSRWASSHREESVEDFSNPDSIEAYLSLPPVSKKEILDAGGVLKYWDAACCSRPHLAQMALDYLTAPGKYFHLFLQFRKRLILVVPASSVDAERAFSGGRLAVNYLQQSMSSQTFRAHMSLGSWVRTPALSEEDCVTILESIHGRCT
jgi:hypothetical protein